MLRSVNDGTVIQVLKNTRFASGSEYLASCLFDFKSNMGLAENIFSRPVNTAYLIRISPLQRMNVTAGLKVELLLVQHLLCNLPSVITPDHQFLFL